MPRNDTNFGNGTLVANRSGCAVQQLIAILPRRHLEPSPAGTEETALIREAKQIGGLPQRQMQPAEILVRQLAACVIQQLDERGLFLLQPSLQRALAHAQFD